MNTTNLVFGSALIIIGIGYLLKSLKFIEPQDAKSISKFLMHTTFPALVFTTMLKVKLSAALGWLPLIAMLFGFLSSYIGFLFFKKEAPTHRGILTMGSAGWNLGLFAYPLIEGIWGWEGLTYAIMFDLGNSVINFMVNYGMGTYLAGNHGTKNPYKHVLKKIFTLPPFQAMLIGLAFNIFKIPVLPLASDIIDTIAKGNKPMVLLLMGIYFSVRLPKTAYTKVFQVLGLRYVLGLSIGLLLYYTVPFEFQYRNMLLICLILPAGMTLITYSDELNFDTGIAAAIVNFSMLISFVIMWTLVGIFSMAPH
ncbi:AEC family transporter [Aquirufa echingensis]|jgi:predicted permease|uniref:AEC family transporter n=1 Tax=Aquirufa echingensis TaxID=3096516 RepID=A0ABW6D041_9BACT